MGHKTQPSVAESIYNARETKYLRKRIHYDYTSLIKRAKANGYSADKIIDESAEIRSKPAYKRNHAAVFPYAFEMPFHILSKYADAVTRVTKNNMGFIAPIMVHFSTMTDTKLAQNASLTMLGNLAYISRKSEYPLVVEWALRMIARLHEITHHRSSRA
jgi:hypothetical protein